MATPMFDDYGIENQAIDRRRAMAQALMQTQAPQGRMVGRVFVGANPLEHLAAGLKQYSGRKDLEQADVDQKALGQQYQARGAADAQKYVDLLRGKESQQFAQPVPNDEEGNAMPPAQSAAVPANPAQAMAFALQSHNPAIQAAGGAQLKEMTASPKWEKAERPKADGSKETGFVNTSSRDPWSTFQLGGTAPVKREFVNGQGVNPYSGETQGAPIPKQADAPNAGKDLLIPDGKGGFMPNTALVGVRKEIANAGKPVTNVSVNTATKPMLTEVGKGVGEQITSDFAGARSAAQTINNVNQIRQGLGSAILGPGANVRIKLAQIGEVLGVNGQDSTEKLQNTRAVMQGLARQELAASGAMKGQGQITESERAILRKAESGQVDELTGPEVNTLLGALEKTSKYRMGVHNQNLERLKKDPNAAGVVDYMKVDAPESNGFKIIGVN